MTKRIVFMVTVALVMAAMMALAGGPALATIHEVAKMECANENASPVVQEQTPPGLTGQSQGSPPNNPTGTNIGQPVFSVTPEGEPVFPGAPPELVGTNPSADGASGNALKAEGC
jgi:hypothetical protein